MSKKNCDSVTMNNDGEIIVEDNFLKNNSAKKSKRFRSAFTTEQINYLESEFKKFRYIGNSNRKEVANVLNISERAVKIWFQNRRMKEKREAGIRDINIEEKYKINTVFSNEQFNNNHKVQLSNDRHSFNKSLPASQNEYSEESNVECKKTRITFNESHSLYEIKPKCTKNDISTIKQNINASTATNNDCNVERPFAPQKLRNDKRKITAQQNFKKKSSCLTHYNNLDKGHKNIGNNLRSLHAPKDGNNMVQDLSLNGTPMDRQRRSHFYPVKSNPDQRSFYTPLYTQSYYIPQSVPAAINSGDVIWKPVGLMPIMPGVGSSPITITHNNPGFSLNHDMTKGTCNCHGPPHAINSGMQCGARIQPHYVLAVPFSNPLHKY